MDSVFFERAGFVFIQIDFESCMWEVCWDSKCLNILWCYIPEFSLNSILIFCKKLIIGIDVLLRSQIFYFSIFAAFTSNSFFRENSWSCLHKTVVFFGRQLKLASKNGLNNFRLGGRLKAIFAIKDQNLLELWKSGLKLRIIFHQRQCSPQF